MNDLDAYRLVDNVHHDASLNRYTMNDYSMIFEGLKHELANNYNLAYQKLDTRKRGENQFNTQGIELVISRL